IERVLVIGMRLRAADGTLQRLFRPRVGAELEIRLCFAHQRLDRLGIAGIFLRVLAEGVGRAFLILALLVEDPDLEGDLFAVRPLFVALGVFLVVLDGAVVLAQRLPQKARVVERVGGMLIVRIPLRQRFVILGGLVVVGDALVDVGDDVGRIGRLRGLRIFVDDLLVGVDGVFGPLGFFQRRAGVVERLRRLRVIRIFLGHAQEEAGGLLVFARARVFLAGFEHRVDDQAIEPVLFVPGGKRLGLLETPRPGLDVLVVLALVERIEDLIAGRAGVRIV